MKIWMIWNQSYTILKPEHIRAHLYARDILATIACNDAICDRLADVTCPNRGSALHPKRFKLERMP